MAASRPTRQSCRRGLTERSAYMPPIPPMWSSTSTATSRRYRAPPWLSIRCHPVGSPTLATIPIPPGLGPPFLTGHQQRDFPILNATACNIPSSAVAYSLNFAVVPHGPLGYMTVWPTGQTRPVVSTLNDIPGQVIANAAIVVAGTSGNVSVYPTSDTDVVIDI